MKKKKAKVKKASNGFGLRLAAALIYLVIAAGLIIGSIFYYGTNHYNTFMDYFNSDRYGYSYFEKDAIVSQDSDKAYGANSDNAIYMYGVNYWSNTEETDVPYIKAYYEVEAVKASEMYTLSQENGKNTATFIGDNGENIELSIYPFLVDWVFGRREFCSRYDYTITEGQINGGLEYYTFKAKTSADIYINVRYPENSNDRYDYEKYITDSYKFTEMTGNYTAEFKNESGEIIEFNTSRSFLDYQDWERYRSETITYKSEQDYGYYAEFIATCDNVKIEFDITVEDAYTAKDKYVFSSEDAGTKTATFVNENNEYLTVSYADSEMYENFVYYGGWNHYEGGLEGFIALAVVGGFCAVLAVLTLIGAWVGKKKRSGNNLCIATGAFMAPALIGLPAFFGGLKGNNALDEMNPEKAKKRGSGFGLRLTFAILILLFAISYSLGLGLSIPMEYFMETFLIAYLPGIIIGVLGILLIIGAVAGRKHRWGNILHIVFGAITCPGYIGFFALVGGIKGNKAIANMPIEEKPQVTEQVAQPELEKSGAVAETNRNALADYPVDYENKPAVSRLLDFDNRENLFLENEDGTTYEFHQLYLTVRGGVIYALTETVGLDEDMRVVFRVDYESDAFHIEEEEKICEDVWNEYVAAVNAQEEEYVEEYIQPKTSHKAKKGITIAAVVSYGLLLLMGILFAAVPAMSGFFSGLGICEDISARAYGITIGTMWVTLAMAVGYVFAIISPWAPNKKGKIIIASVSTVLLIVMNVVFFIIINTVKLEISPEILDSITDEKELEKWLEVLASGEALKVKEFYEGADTWFIPVSTVFASLSIIICHALTFFKINPNKIKARKPVKCGDGIVEIIKHVLASIVYGIMCMVKFILTFKEKLPEVFILVAAILLTWLAHFVSFVVAIVVIVMLIGVVVMYFAGLISWVYTPATGEKTALTVDGKPVTEQSYVIDDRYQKVYKDENGNEYVSDDGGKTVSEYHRFNDN